MTRGFYTLGSGLLTQNRILSTISNNMANVKTPGFKKNKMLTTTFDEMLMSRIDANKTEIGNVSVLRTMDVSVKVHSQGMLDESERPLDFALMGEGFFEIQGFNGETVYTRNGSFNLDEQGYLILEGVGRVIGTNGAIRLATDEINADSKGNIFDTQGRLLGKFAISNFDDYNEIITIGEGLYTGNPARVDDYNIMWKYVEGSNVDVGEEMTNTIATQRILQSVSQALKMYDATLATAVTQIAKIN